MFVFFLFCLDSDNEGLAIRGLGVPQHIPLCQSELLKCKIAGRYLDPILKPFYIVYMAEGIPPDMPASGLSQNERQALFQALKKHSNVFNEILYTEDSGAEDVPLEEEFTRLSLLWRIWFSILGALRTKSAAAAYEDNRIAKAGRAIERSAPDIFDSKKARLLPACNTQFEKLKNAAHFFHSVINAGFNRDKGEFFAFLASLEMEAAHIAIQRVTDFPTLESLYPEAAGAELRKQAAQGMEQILEETGEEMKKAMYSDARFLFCLKEFSIFPFDRIMKQFSFEPLFGADCCSVILIKDLLLMLNNILFSLKQVPGIALFESLFVFMQHERRNKTEFNTASLEEMMTKAEQQLETIREFNKTIPLTKIISFCFKDMMLGPSEISGGEDWMSIYRDYWKRQIETNFTIYKKNHKEKELHSVFNTFFKGAVYKPFPGTANADPNGIPMRSADALAFLSAFYSTIFVPDMNETLKVFLIEGEFRQKDEYTEFTESYNTFFIFENSIRKLERDISPHGEFGIRYAKARQETNVQPLAKRRKCDNIANEADVAAMNIAAAVYNASKYFAVFLHKISFRESSDIIINLPKLSFKYPFIIKNIPSITRQFQQAIQMMDNINAVITQR